MWTCISCHVRFVHESIEQHVYQNHLLPKLGRRIKVYRCGDDGCSFTADGFEAFAVHCFQEGHSPTNVVRGLDHETYVSQLFIGLEDVVKSNQRANNEALLAADRWHHPPSPEPPTFSHEPTILAPFDPSQNHQRINDHSNSGTPIDWSLAASYDGEEQPSQKSDISPSVLSFRQSSASSNGLFSSFNNKEPSTGRQQVEHGNDTETNMNNATNNSSVPKIELLPNEDKLTEKKTIHNSFEQSPSFRDKAAMRRKTTFMSGSNFSRLKPSVYIPQRTTQEGISEETYMSPPVLNPMIANPNNPKRRTADSRNGPDERPLTADELSKLQPRSEKRFPCSMCPKSFDVKATLEIHTRTHTGERPYGCSYCCKRFARGGDLRKHIRIHTGEKPYKCDECGLRFTQSTSVTSHKNRHHRKTDGMNE